MLWSGCIYEEFLGLQNTGWNSKENKYRRMSLCLTPLLGAIPGANVLNLACPRAHALQEKPHLDS